MTKKEFKEVFKIAVNHEYITSNTLENETMQIFEGLLCEDKKRIATRKHCAYMLNYQCKYLNGEYDMQEVEKIREAYLKFVELID